jgi:hypothetical protein
MKYEVGIMKELLGIVEVEAENPEEAEKKVREGNWYYANMYCDRENEVDWELDTKTPIVEVEDFDLEYSGDGDCPDEED